MTIQKSKDKPLQFDSNLEKIIIRTFEKRSKNVRKIVAVKGRYCISEILFKYIPKINQKIRLILCAFFSLFILSHFKK
jgi:hypothetical protein